MKKTLLGLFILLLLTACSGKKAKEERDKALLAKVDSALTQDSIDSLVHEAVSVPAKADELFDDFMYHFGSDARFQLRRIVFPLKVVDNKDKITFVPKEEWTHDHLFSQQVYYTLIFDNEKDMEIDKDTTINNVQIEWTYMTKHMTKQYNFERVGGRWMLTYVRKYNIEPTKEENFTDFFYKFANDSLYQREHIQAPLKFITTDPDDDFSVLETTMEVDQWFAFRPQLPKNTLTNINYGQKCKNPNTRILSLKGIGNGFNNTFYFKRRGSEWRLVAFEDMSD